MTAQINPTTSFAYTIYIHASPKQVWQGLTEPAMTRLYWRHQRAGVKTFRSDWHEGSTWDLEHPDVGLSVSDPEQVILESTPYSRLVYTWHSFTAEWAAKVGMDETTRQAWRAGRRSKVTYDIEPTGKDVTRLTIVHDGFSSGSPVLRAISEGWPAVLSGLKTVLETGSSSPTA